MPESTPEPGTPQMPEGVDLSSISDSTIELLGLDRTRIEQLKEANLKEVLQKEGKEFYLTNKHSMSPEDSALKADFTLEIGRLKFQIPSGTTLNKLPDIITTNFKQRTQAPETNNELQQLHLWLSSYMEAAFQEKDWTVVLPTADSIDKGVETLPRLREIARGDFEEGLRIAQAYENYIREKESEKGQAAAEPPLRPVPTPVSPDESL